MRRSKRQILKASQIWRALIVNASFLIIKIWIDCTGNVLHEWRCARVPQCISWTGATALRIFDVWTFFADRTDRRFPLASTYN
jgi:hypothetical protein